MSHTYLSDTKFEGFDLPASVLGALAELNYSHCTEIQAEILPVALSNKDVAGQAQTGTGKTAAFLVAMFTRLVNCHESNDRNKNQPSALVVAPTRELAIQIHKDGEALGAKTGLSLGLIYGGASYDKQIELLNSGVDIIIGTPGRLIDFNKRKLLDLSRIDVVVLDEADRMFDLGFISDIRYLFRQMPKPEKRLSMLFSATLSPRVLELAYEHMNSPKSIVIESETVVSGQIRQTLYHPASEEKTALLIGLLNKLKPERSIIFVNTKRVGEKIWAILNANNLPAALLSGDVPQKKRVKLLEQFQNGQWPILIATDVVARGLHIPSVSHVFNYDLPQQEEEYVHRIGRTARAGAVGDAVSFACEEYAFSLQAIEAYIGEPIPVSSITDDLLATNIIKPPQKKLSTQRKPQPRNNRRPRRGAVKKRT